MKFSTRTTYGIRAMIVLAKNYKSGSLPLSQIAKQENISLKYLEKLFAVLKRERLIKAEKGAQGGYKLSKSPAEIKIFDIVETLEGEMVLFHCIGKRGEILCSTGCNCGATSVLLKVQSAINTTLKSMKLSDLL
jgi:Rrf2 family transcriptional regulator, cysteine metabolism repressor